MLKDSISGLDTVFKTDVYRGAIIIVSGPPGSLKSGFSYEALSRYLRDRDEFGIYITIEENTESHLRNMQSLGIEIPSNLIISDYSDIRKRFEDSDSHPDFLDMVTGVIDYFKNEKGDKFTCMALDSLGALYSLIDMDSNLRSKMYSFFQRLRRNKLTSFIIMETPHESNIQSFTGSEVFLADGIIDMGMVETRADTYLYLQVKKMRATNHSRKKYLVEVTSDGLNVIDELFE